jgi:hypothetical protein
MIVRIRFGCGPKVAQKRRKNQRVALAMAALLTPAALMAFVLGLWRMAADLQWTNDFAIADGILSHWQVWIAAALLLQFVTSLLNRYGHGGDPGPYLP